MPEKRSQDEFDDELLSAYLDNEVTPEERAAVDERLQSDEAARQRLAQLQSTSEAVRTLPGVKLGRDLRAGVLAELQRLDPVTESPPVLTMPERDNDDERSTGSRGLMWVVLAAAAALMLMVLRPADQPPNDEPEVARRAPNEKTSDASRSGRERAAFSGPPGERGDLERSDPDALRAAATEPTPLRRDRDDPLQERMAPNDSAPSAAVEIAAAAPSAASSAALPRTETRAGSANDEDDQPSAGPATNDVGLRVLEVTMRDEDAVATFERLLTDHGIALSVAEGTASLAESANAPSRRRAIRAAAEPADVANSARLTAYLVETSPERLDELVAALQDNSGAFDALSDADVDAARTIVASFPVDRVELPPGQPNESRDRAWRLALSSDLTADAGADQPTESQAAPRGGAAAARGRPLQERFGSAADGNVRVLFVLRPAAP